MPVISLSLSETEAKRLDELANEKKVSRSQLMRNAIARYDFDQRWRSIRAEGDRVAAKLAIECDEDVERVFG